MISWSLESGDEGPLSGWVLSPGVGGHEWPVGESVLRVVILWSSGENHGAGSHWRDQVTDFVLGSNASIGLDFEDQVSIGRDLTGKIMIYIFKMITWWGGLPCHSQHNHFSSIQNSESEEMVVLESDSVHLPLEMRAVSMRISVVVLDSEGWEFTASSIEKRVTAGSQDGQVLKISPVIILSSVSTCPNEDGSKSVTSLVDTFHDCSHCGVTWSINSLSIISWTPGGRVDVDLVWLVSHRVGFNEIGHVRLVKHPDSCDLSVVGDSDTADSVVASGNDFSGTASSVGIEPVISVSWIWEWIVGREVVRCFGILERLR
ncbi:hypothetical protein GCK72_017606 [Caenorhabditis remanei]|uniref:Uncharacterized protein n=1 Tax=Caenorhabditis remanei TaxID=31234 RepID=A0A6A5G8Y4_CAERE|nr:hypothetical protein GCK72_017606 [Caenorhabditis remanei]KAF1751054.1 hypothetical protein GCK72_017606 [Caenorhabditis remanei]